MKKKIFVIFTGGTICTKIKNGIMSTDDSAAYAICDFYEHSPYSSGNVFLTKGKCFNILSENMTTEKWNEIINYFKENIQLISEYDGIIILHGTDTLAYSSALFSLILKGFNTPVFFVSANAPITLENGDKNPLSNGCENFEAAIKCIENNISPGVYATYKNPEDNKMYLHKGENLIQCKIYDDNFYSFDMKDISKAPLPAENNSKCKPLIYSLPQNPLSECILKINPYPGMNYNFFSLTNVKAVLHGTYHSGTACTFSDRENVYNFPQESSIIYFLDKCTEKNIPLYFSPSKISEGDVYESVPFIANHPSYGKNTHIFYGKTDELMYAYLLLYHSLKDKIENISDLLI